MFLANKLSQPLRARHMWMRAVSVQTSTGRSTKTRLRVPNVQRGLLDTSVVVDLEGLPVNALPLELAIAAVTLAELAAGPHATTDPLERAKRQTRLQLAETTFEVIPFGADAARSYALMYAAVLAAGRKSRGRRALDLMIAATAHATDIPLYTRNAADFAGLHALIRVVSL